MYTDSPNSPNSPRLQWLMSSGHVPIVCYAFSPKESYLAVALQNHTIDLYEKDGNEWKKRQSIAVPVRFQHSDISQLLCFSDDKNILIYIEDSIVHFINLNKIEQTLPYFYSTEGKILAICYKNNILTGVTENGLFIKQYLHNYKSWAGTSRSTPTEPSKALILEKYIIIAATSHLYIYSIKKTEELYVPELVKIKQDFYLKHMAISPCEKYLAVSLNECRELKELKVFCLSNKHEEISIPLLPDDIKGNYVKFRIKQDKFLFIFPENNPARVIKYEKNKEDIIKYSCGEYIGSSKMIHFISKLPDGKTATINTSNSLLQKNKISGLSDILKEYTLDKTNFYFSPEDNYLIIQSKEPSHKLMLISLEGKSITSMKVMNSPGRLLGASCTDYIMDNNLGKLKTSAISQDQQYIVSIFEQYAEIRELANNHIMRLYDLGDVECCDFLLNYENGHLLAIKNPTQLIFFKFNFKEESLLKLEKTDLNEELNCSSIHFIDKRIIMLIARNGLSVHFINFHTGFLTKVYNIPQNITPILLPKTSGRFLSYENNTITEADLYFSTRKSTSLIIEVSLQSSPHTPRSTSPIVQSNTLSPPLLTLGDPNDSAISISTLGSPARTSHGNNFFQSPASTPIKYSSNTVFFDKISCFSPNGYYLAIYRHHSTEIFETHFGRKVQCITHTHNVSFYEFSPCSHYLAIVCVNTLYIYSIVFGIFIQKIDTQYKIEFCKFYSNMSSIFVIIEQVGLTSYRLDISNSKIPAGLLKEIIDPLKIKQFIAFSSYLKDYINFRGTKDGEFYFINNQILNRELVNNENVNAKVKNCCEEMLNILSRFVVDINQKEACFLTAFLFGIMGQGFLTALFDTIIAQPKRLKLFDRNSENDVIISEIRASNTYINIIKISVYSFRLSFYLSSLEKYTLFFEYTLNMNEDTKNFLILMGVPTLMISDVDEKKEIYENLYETVKKPYPSPPPGNSNLHMKDMLINFKQLLTASELPQKIATIKKVSEAIQNNSLSEEILVSVDNLD